MGTLAIPILPCISLSDTLSFYGALGFEVTHRQERPSIYAALQRDELHLHFMGIPKLQPKDAYSACLIVVDRLEPLYTAFCAALRSSYGKLPLKGAPRISRMRPGASRFTLVDVAGNSLIVVQSNASDDYDESRYAPTSNTTLGKALHTARRLRDFRNDDEAAARVLDIALRKPDAGSVIDRARALAARAELALAQGDAELAASTRAELDRLPLTAADREHYASELEAPERLENLEHLR